MKMHLLKIHLCRKVIFWRLMFRQQLYEDYDSDFGISKFYKGSLVDLKTVFLYYLVWCF